MLLRKVSFFTVASNRFQAVAGKLFNRKKEGIKVRDGMKNNLPQTVAGIMDNDPSKQIECMAQIRNLLSMEKNSPIKEIVDAFVVPRFVYFIDSDDDIIREEVREEAIWALGKIANDSRYSSTVMNSGALESILVHLETMEEEQLVMTRVATFALSSFCKYDNLSYDNQCRVALPTLAKLISHRDDEVIIHACHALLNYSSDEYAINQVIHAGTCSGIFELLKNPSPAVQMEALKMIEKFLVLSVEEVLDLVDANMLSCFVECLGREDSPALQHGALGVLSKVCEREGLKQRFDHDVLICLLTYLLSHLTSPKKDVQEKACWIIANIMAGTCDQIQAVFDSNIIPPLMQLYDDAEISIRKPIICVIFGAVSGGTSLQIRFLVARGCIRPLCDILSADDPRIVTVALSGLEKIIMEGETDAKVVGAKNKMTQEIIMTDGPKKMKTLLNGSNETISHKSKKILDTLFPAAEEE